MSESQIIEAPQRALVQQDSTPNAMLMLAVQRGDDMERIKQLMDLQDRWEAGQSLKAYNEDFAAFKAEAVTLVKNRKVTDGPLKGKGYAELHAVVNAITPALSRHGLSASWKLSKDERDWIEVTCYLKHSRGHSESVSMGGPPDTGGAKNPIQARASTVSYLERYTLKAIVGLAEQDSDDDGNGGPDDAAKVKRGAEMRSMVADMGALFSEGREMDVLTIWRNPKHWNADAGIANDERAYAWGEIKHNSKLRAFLQLNDRKENTK